MTPEQFSALAALMGLASGKSAVAARLVLVEGLSSAEAARRVGITTQGANQAVQRCRRVVELARVVVRRGVNQSLTTCKVCEEF
jgi:DNA-directed RNA polymerase specialized sigma24 family protein